MRLGNGNLYQMYSERRTLGLQELLQDKYCGIEDRSALFGQVVDGLRNVIHVQAAQHDDDGGSGGIMTHGGPRRSGRAGHHSARHWPLARGAKSAPVGCREGGHR